MRNKKQLYNTTHTSVYNVKSLVAKISLVTYSQNRVTRKISLLHVKKRPLFPASVKYCKYHLYCIS